MTPESLREILLEKRSIGADDQESFLHPDFVALSDPFLMEGMDRAVTRIIQAIKTNESIVIYADYDADGIPGSVILNDALCKLGSTKTQVYIPHRHNEGYGLHQDAVSKLIDEGAKLIITVDLGITAHETALYVKERDIDLIITDHHEPIGTIPEAYAVVNPKLGNYPDRMLCGSGVAFRLVQAIIKKLRADEDSIVADLPHGWEKWLLDMVGIATLSDMVPLLHENRILATFGMRVLQKSPRPGLRALMRYAKISQESLTEDDVVFSITPKLNVASRMANPRDAFDLLSTPDTGRADILTQYLVGLGDERKKETARIMRDVHKKMKSRQPSPIIVIGDPSWNHGVLGLVATKLSEEYLCSSFVWSTDGQVVRGSCRSYGSASMVRLMEHVAPHFMQFGGHDGAGGFTVSRDNIHTLESELMRAWDELGMNSKKSTAAAYDTELTLTDITMHHHAAIRELAPFGCENPKPTFLFQNVIIASCKQFGKQKEHLEIIVTDDTGKRVKAISFFTSPEDFNDVCKEGSLVNLIAQFDYSEYMNRPELRLRIVDILSIS
ncbi:MAG: single-stranded-DNA-specific exonuclease RecJ [Candidatus Pacebacteria bacterium]|nr:single-stranded-DNA-specific exonuclease RecJ [Candidatus Paceibacterota bacterium]